MTCLKLVRREGCWIEMEPLGSLSPDCQSCPGPRSWAMWWLRVWGSDPPCSSFVFAFYFFIKIICVCFHVSAGVGATVCRWMSEDNFEVCPHLSTSFVSGFLAVNSHSAVLCWASSEFSCLCLSFAVMSVCGDYRSPLREVWGWNSGTPAWLQALCPLSHLLSPYFNFGELDSKT